MSHHAPGVKDVTSVNENLPRVEILLASRVAQNENHGMRTFRNHACRPVTLCRHDMSTPATYRLTVSTLKDDSRCRARCLDVEILSPWIAGLSRRYEPKRRSRSMYERTARRKSTRRKSGHNASQKKSSECAVCHKRNPDKRCSPDVRITKSGSGWPFV